jgi:hypothetical protein
MEQKKSSALDREATVASTELARVNKNLSRIGILSAALAMCATISSLVSTHLQREQLALQNQQLKLQNEHLAQQKAEQNQIHGVLDLVPDVQPEGLFVHTKFENKSGRAIHLWMLGVRIFKAHGFVPGTTVKTKPELLLHAESSIDECPVAICPPGGKSLDRVYNHARSGGSVSLAPGGVHEELFGPYPISEVDFKAGFWIQGFGYPRESDSETCVIVEQPSVPGAFPRICEESRKTLPECWTSAQCPYERKEIRFQHSNPG